MSAFEQKIGTNPVVRDKSATFCFPSPLQFVAKRCHLFNSSESLTQSSKNLSEQEVLYCDPFRNRPRTFRDLVAGVVNFVLRHEGERL